MTAIPKQKRLPMILFGAIVVVFFVGFAVAEGLGNPSVPSGDVAKVEDAPSGLGTITQTAFDRSLQQTAARAGAKKVPKPGDPEYDGLKQGAMNDLLDQVWIQGEAADLGITASASEVSSLLQQTIAQNFRTKAEFEKFRKQSHFSQKDIRDRIRLQILSTKIQQQVLKGVAPVTESQVRDYYDAAKSQFVQPAARDVRLVLNKDKAKVDQAQAELEQDSSDANWKRVAAQFSTDASSKSNGGLRPSLTNGLLEEPLNGNVFAAPIGRIEGPVKTPVGYYVFEVQKETPGRTLPLDKSTTTQIRSQLTQQAQQNAFSQFVDDFGSKWRARTFCASGYLIDRCNNFAGASHPATAPVGCYQANPKGGRPASCPAPVAQLAPASPGSVSIVTPQGTRLPQRPIPGGVTAVAGGGLSGGLPPGAAPAGGAPTGTAP